MLKKTLPVLFFLFSFFALFAQETEVRKKGDERYRFAKELYSERLYAESNEVLKVYLSETERDDNDAYVRESRLLLAKSALFAGFPEGEKLLLSYYRENLPERTAQDALLTLSDYYYRNKQYQQAIKYYSLYEPGKPDPAQKAEVDFKKAYSHFIREEYEEAEKGFKAGKDIKETPYYYESNYYYGILAYENEKNEEALTAFHNAGKSKEFEDVVPYYKCQIHFANEQYPEVISNGEFALKEGTDHDQEINHLVGKAYYELGDYEKALPYLEKFSDEAESLRAQDLYQVAYTRYETGNYDKAIEAFEELKVADSELGQNALYQLGNGYMRKGYRTRARNAYGSASRMNYDPDIARLSNFKFAKLSYEEGFDTEAINALQKVKPTDPEYQESRRLLGKIFLNTNDYDRALSIMEGIPNKTPDIKEAYQKVAYLKAVNAYADGNTREAKVNVRKSLSYPIDAKTRAMGHYLLGDIAHQEGRYDDSTKEMDQFLTIARTVSGLPETQSTATANYIQGYNYLKTGNETFAGEKFEKTVSEIKQKWTYIYSPEIKDRLYPDALLRAGDMQFLKGRYDAALAHYGSSVQYGHRGFDYALFQTAIIRDLQNKPVEHINALKELINRKPESNYADDALYTLGVAYYREGNASLAEDNFKRLLQNHERTSDYTNRTYLMMGLIRYQQTLREQSLAYYEKVFSNNPTPEESDTALRYMEGIYIDNNDPEGYLEARRRILGYDESMAVRDSITFKAADAQLENNNLEGAVSGYDNYLRKFPSGRYVIKAHYNRAETLVALTRYDDALQGYEYLVQRGNNPYYEKAAGKAANIHYNHTGNFTKAYQYYTIVSDISGDPEKQYAASVQALRSAYRANDDLALDTAADNILEHPLLTKKDEELANFYKAKIAYKEEDYNTALNYFRLSANGNNAIAAESRYTMARIYYLKRDLTIAESLCMKHVKTATNYKEWVAKGFLLLADINLEQGDAFGARIPLETLIETYNEGENPEIVAQAKAKLKLVEELEERQSRIEDQ